MLDLQNYSSSMQLQNKKKTFAAKQFTVGKGTKNNVIKLVSHAN